MRVSHTSFQAWIVGDRAVRETCLNILGAHPMQSQARSAICTLESVGVHREEHAGECILVRNAVHGCRRMTLSFGYLNKIGYKGFVFPIVIGEAGSRYTDVSHSCSASVLCLCSSCTVPGSCQHSAGCRSCVSYCMNATDAGNADRAVPLCVTRRPP